MLGTRQVKKMSENLKVTNGYWLWAWKSFVGILGFRSQRSDIGVSLLS
jgi:hypothetical protein